MTDEATVGKQEEKSEDKVPRVLKNSLGASAVIHSVPVSCLETDLWVAEPGDINLQP